MKLGLIQANLEWNNPDANVAHLQTLGASAVQQGAEFVIFPEMFTTGFSLLAGAEAKKAGEVGTQFLMSFAQEHKVYCCGSMPKARDNDFNKPFNTLELWNPEGKSSSYSKLHLFSFGGETEKYRAGDSTLNLKVGPFQVSCFICYDLRFPTPFATLANTTELYVVVANWPSPRREHWKTLLAARAIENQAFVVGVNRVGEGGGLKYSGDSRVISPKGEILCDCGENENVQVCEIDLNLVHEWRKSFSCLRDRRS